MEKYEARRLDCSLDIDLNNLSGRSAIVTGGASGLGEAYVEALVKAGVFVTIADRDQDAGARLAQRFKDLAQFVKCDVCDWNDQVKVFKAAVQNSPRGGCDIVVANAGISGADSVFQLDDISAEPVKPDLSIVNVNLIGVLYTVKLALHYFRQWPLEESRDRCLIIKGSVAGYLDQPGSPQYNASKFAGRGLMRSLRRTSWMQGIRVNYVAPWYIKTLIMNEIVQRRVASKGVDFAEKDDACKAILYLATHKDANGRAIAIVPRKWATQGFVDLDHDDYPEGDRLREWQELVLLTSHRIPVPDDAV